MRFFVQCNLKTLSPEEFTQLVYCRMNDRAPLWEMDGELVDIDLECPDDPCVCAAALRQWRDNWSQMPKWR